MSTNKSYRIRAIGFLRGAIRQRRIMIRGNYSRKPETESSITKIEESLAKAGDSVSAAKLIMNMEPHITHILPTKITKGINKWQKEYYELLNEGKQLLKTQ